MGELPSFRRIPHDQREREKLLRREHYGEKIYCPGCGHFLTSLVAETDCKEQQGHCSHCKRTFVYGIENGVKYLYAPAGRPQMPSAAAHA